MKKTALAAAKVTVSAALLAYLLAHTDLAALLARIRTGDVLLLGVAVSLYLVALGLATWRWQLLLETQGFTAPLGALSASYLVATFFNNFLPSNIGGDFIRVRDGSSLTGSTTTSLAIVAIDRIVGLGALYVLGAAAFVLGGPSVRQFAGARLVLGGLGLVFAVLAYVFFMPGTTERILSAVGLFSRAWARERFEVVQQAVHVYRARVAAVWLAFAGSVALQAVVVFYYWAVAHALRVPLPLEAAFLMVPLCTLIQTVPISFNGWGLREGLFIVYFGQLGLSRDSALAFSLVGAGLVVLLSLSGAVVWAARGPVAPSPSTQSD